jgi:hypothetical protein
MIHVEVDINIERNFFKKNINIDLKKYSNLNILIMKIKEWLNKGDGGEWYEPYVTNRDLIIIGLITLIVSGIIILGCYLSKFYYL